MRSVAQRIGVAVIAAAAICGFFTSPAHAEMDDCEEGSICLWTEANYGGELLQLQHSVSNILKTYPDFAGKVVGVWNRTQQPWCLYRGQGFTLKRIQVNVGATQDDLEIWEFRNLTKSLRLGFCAE
ncbi:peptidase inhibitor family I36 protein [Streptomyces sparsogenes]|uniref:peptidase inhibitor family I36 protein n=1 Tax=Streptomyces sparsogenes TaxID=67365 RepID=UPI0033311201